MVKKASVWAAEQGVRCCVGHNLGISATCALGCRAEPWLAAQRVLWALNLGTQIQLQHSAHSRTGMEVSPGQQFLHTAAGLALITHLGVITEAWHVVVRVNGLGAERERDVIAGSEGDLALNHVQQRVGMLEMINNLDHVHDVRYRDETQQTHRWGTHKSVP